MDPVSALEYYHRLFPYDALVAWMTSQGHALQSFEFAIEAQDASGERYMKRFLSVRTAAELREQAISHKGILAIHFGGIFSGPVFSAAEPTERIFSIDVDLTDYEYLDLHDEHGNVSAELCDKAYPVSAFAVAVLMYLLHCAFDFTNVLIVYSGRRGVHLHVMDPRAIAMDNEARAAVVDFIKQDRKLDTPASINLHGLADMYKLVPFAMEAFERSWVGEMELFDSATRVTNFVNMLDLTHHTLESLADDASEVVANGARRLGYERRRVDADQVAVVHPGFAQVVQAAHGERGAHLRVAAHRRECEQEGGPPNQGTVLRAQGVAPRGRSHPQGHVPAVGPQEGAILGRLWQVGRGDHGAGAALDAPPAGRPRRLGHSRDERQAGVCAASASALGQGK